MLLAWNKSPERNAGDNYAFAKIGPRIGDFRAAPSVIPCFVTLTVENDKCFVDVGPEQRRMRPRTASHCVFAKCDLE